MSPVGSFRLTRLMAWWLWSAAILPGFAEPTRSPNGLLALYDFTSPDGDLVRDRSGSPDPVDLKISDTREIRWTEGSMEFIGKAILRSSRSATRLSDSIRLTGRLTVEAWLRPAALDQTGPARILTISSGSSSRNFTLGQDGPRFEVRMRHTRSTDNGQPSLATPPDSATTNLTHVVYTRDRVGRTRLYLDGQLVREEVGPGTTVNWDGSYPIALGNELSNDRPWRGTLHLVALYSRELLPEEVEAHFAAGPKATTAVSPLANRSKTSPADPHFFNREIAPLLSKYCLECHDPALHKGKLDLSRRETALVGSSSGPILQPGHATNSLLWKVVESDEMPEERPPLPAREKALLRDWINAGAAWPDGTVDPAAHTLSRLTGQNWPRRLTVPEYIETLRSTVGVDLEKDALSILPKDQRADGFSNTAYNLGVDLGHVEAFARLAAIAVDRMDVPAFIQPFAKSRDKTPENFRKVIEALGRFLLRAPPEENEVVAFLNVATAALDHGADFNATAATVIEAMLQSPRFLYRIENQRGDGTVWPVSDPELAVRWSYLLWGAPPDAELLRAVEAGELHDRRQLGPQVDRLLKDPRVIRRSLRFVTEWLDLDRLENLRPNPTHFPAWDPQLAADMRKETLAFFEDVIWKQERPLSALLNAQVTHVTPRLAALYGLTTSGDERNGLTRHDLTQVSSRGGLLTQGSLLTIGGDEASMVTRGLFVLNDILRGAVNNPPPGLNTRPIPARPGLSRRDVAQQRIENATCGACHVRFETLAFGLERFDGIGAFHEKDEHGNSLREDGEILFPGQAQPVSFNSTARLMDLLAEHPRVQENLSRKVLQFSIGRPLTPGDSSAVARIHAAAMASGGTYRSLLREIALSDLVLTTPTETE